MAGGNATNAITTSAICSGTCTRSGSRDPTKCAQRYPASRSAWKQSEQTIHTDGEPPKSGTIIRATSGWRLKSSVALMKSVATKRFVRIDYDFSMPYLRRYARTW